jgi:hypothetical protein
MLVFHLIVRKKKSLGIFSIGQTQEGYLHTPKGSVNASIHLPNLQVVQYAIVSILLLFPTIKVLYTLAWKRFEYNQI